MQLSLGALPLGPFTFLHPHWSHYTFFLPTRRRTFSHSTMVALCFVLRSRGTMGRLRRTRGRCSSGTRQGAGRPRLRARRSCCRTSWTRPPWGSGISSPSSVGRRRWVGGMVLVWIWSRFWIILRQSLWDNRFSLCRDLSIFFNRVGPQGWECLQSDFSLPLTHYAIIIFSSRMCVASI